MISMEAKTRWGVKEVRTGAVQETILPREHAPVDVDMSRLARHVDEAKLRHLSLRTRDQIGRTLVGEID